MLSRVKRLTDRLLARSSPAIPVTPNTFFVWEPCSHSHAEVVPGFAKYLLDLGFDVAVLLTPDRIDEGLFSRFSHDRLTVHRLSQPMIRRYFKKNGLSNAKGVMVTTARKIGGKQSYQAEYSLFAHHGPDQPVLLVEHDIKQPTDDQFITEDIITLQTANYKNTPTHVVNPHYFGDMRVTEKNQPVTRFITVGALRARRRNTSILIDAVVKLHARGVSNFKVTVIGNGSLNDVPPGVRHLFEIKGRVNFSRLYEEMENADFFLPLLDPENPSHQRYLTTGTSGNFQLILGFAKPCLMAKKFAPAVGFDDQNSIVYESNADLAEAMINAINMTPGEYNLRQQALQKLASSLYAKSLDNLRRLVTN